MRRVLGAAALVVVAFAPVVPAASEALVETGYVVVLRPSAADVDETAARLSGSVSAELGDIYETALDGFSVTATTQEAAALARNPLVAYVERDVVVTNAQVTPTGVDRSFAAGNVGIDIDGQDDARVDVDVAVLDGGIDLQHPDLVVAGGVDCTVGTVCIAGGDDPAFHGTHVAGVVGALDNGVGVVGVAPGARLWAVKVLDQTGQGLLSWLLRGIDWVVANAGTIEVANLSLGAPGFSQAMYDAVRSAVDAGVAFAVAAGNFDVDAAGFSPAVFDNVLTVSALADFDGASGGLGSPTCRGDQDDSLADFSNWGAVDLVAPGSCILSTVPIEQGSYGTLSGTSMAAPHVAGALALLARTKNPNSAADVAAMYTTLVATGNTNWTDDSGDGVKEPLLDLSVPSLFTAVQPACAAVATVGLVGWWSASSALASVIGPPLTGSSAITDGVVGRGWLLDASASLSTADVATVSTGVTAEAWVKPLPAATVQVLLSRWAFPSTDDSARVFSLSLMPNGDLVWETDETTTRRPTELRVRSAGLHDGSFHHIAATWDTFSMELFVDGLLVGTRPSGGGLLNGASTTPVRLGSKSGIADPFRFVGVLDEASVWERALEAAEVAAIHAAGPAGKCPPIP